MQKIKNPILCWIVILAVFIRPTPAQANPAVLVPLAVGALISGTLVAGSGVYSQAAYSAANDAADAVSGAVSREVLVAKMIGVSGQAMAYGVASQVKLDYDKLCDWVQAHPSDYPMLSVPVKASNTPQPTAPTVNEVVTGSNGLFYKIVSITDNGMFTGNSGFPLSYWLGEYSWDVGGRVMKAPADNNTYFIAFFNFVEISPGICRAHQYTIQTTLTASLPNIFPNIRDRTKFAPAYAHSPALQAEIDKMIFANPAAVVSKPVALTPAQIVAAQAAEAARVAQAAATAAQTASTANPTDTNLQAAAAQAKALADQAAIEASGEQAKVEATPEELPKVDTPPVSLSPPAAHVALDFSPLYALSGQATSHYPFNILSSAASYFSCLVAEPQPPSFIMPTVFGKTCTFDLAAWSPSASVMRGAMLFFFNILCMVAIVRRWS